MTMATKRNVVIAAGNVRMRLEEEGLFIRRGRPNALRVRASASVVGELAWRVNRFERGEGGGVT